MTLSLRTFDDVRRVCSAYGWNGSNVAPIAEEDIARLEGFADEMLTLGHPLADIEIHKDHDALALCFSSHPYAPSREKQRVRVRFCMPGPTGWEIADASPYSDEDDDEYDWEDQVDATTEVRRRLERPAFVPPPPPLPIAIGTIVYLPSRGIAVPHEVVNAMPVAADGDVPEHLTVMLYDTLSGIPKDEYRHHVFASSLDPALHRTPTGALFEIVAALENERELRLELGRQHLARWSAQGSRLHSLYVELASRHELDQPVTPEIAALVEQLFDSFCERRVQDSKDEEQTNKLLGGAL